MHPLVLPYSPRRPLSRNRKLINYPRMKHSLTESRAYDSRRTVSFLIHVSGDIRQKFGYPILHAIAIDDPRIIASSVLYHCFYLVTFSSAARMAVPHPNQTILLYIFSKTEREREREREREGWEGALQSYREFENSYITSYVIHHSGARNPGCILRARNARADRSRISGVVIIRWCAYQLADGPANRRARRSWSATSACPRSW